MKGAIIAYQQHCTIHFNSTLLCQSINCSTKTGWFADSYETGVGVKYASSTLQHWEILACLGVMSVLQLSSVLYSLSHTNPINFKGVDQFPVVPSSHVPFHSEIHHVAESKHSLTANSLRFECPFKSRGVVCPHSVLLFFLPHTNPLLLLIVGLFQENTLSTQNDSRFLIKRRGKKCS